MLKNKINKEILLNISKQISLLSTEFNSEKFSQDILDSVLKSQFELKDRIKNSAIAIHEALPLSFVAQTEILKKIAPKHNSLVGLIFPQFVELYGLSNWDYALDALRYFTQFSTSEYAIRAFIREDPERIMALLKCWALDPNAHVRRLASEGCRPRLPWAGIIPWLKKNPEAIFAILEILKNDAEIYVRKSVANNLNDLSKDYPELVLKYAEKWYGSTQNLNWVVKHGLRNLLRKGNPAALKICIYKNPKHFRITQFKIEKNIIKIGEYLNFSFCCQNSKRQAEIFRLEYALHFLRLNKTYYRKIFKIKELKLDYNNLLSIEKKHLLIQRSTRTLYKGKHKVELIVNGKSFASKAFLIR